MTPPRPCATCGDPRNTCRHTTMTTTRPDLDALEQIANDWRGRFFHDVERGDIAFVAADCAAKECDCEVKLNADGDQNCAVSVAAVDCGDVDDAGAPLATMLNALPALVAEVRRLETSGRLAVDLAEGCQAELTAERDAHHATCDALARERAEVERLWGLLAIPHEPEPTYRMLKSGAARVTFSLCGEDVDIPANRALSLGAALIRASIRTEGGLP